MANTQNLASGTLAEDITASATTVLAYVGDGSVSTIKAVWPTAPFFITVMPHNPVAGVSNSLDSEVMRVTAVGNDQVGNVALTVERAQRGTTAKSFTAGAIVTNGVYMEDILDRIYPVGSIYMSATLSTTTQVANALGGTWEAFGAGRVPVGVDTTQTEFNTVLKTGGEKTHILTNGELPKLSGTGQFKPYDSYSTSGIVSGMTWHESKNFSAAGGLQSNSTIYGFKIEFGGDGAHNNLQPYITCYMYRRTA